MKKIVMALAAMAMIITGCEKNETMDELAVQATEEQNTSRANPNPDFLEDGIYYVITSPTTVSVNGTTVEGDLVIPTAVAHGGQIYSVTAIEGGAFINCNGLKTVTVPEGITEIPEWTFASCSSLEDVYLPNTVTTIGEHGFYYCVNLKLHVPSSLKKIEDWAFQMPWPNNVEIHVTDMAAWCQIEFPESLGLPFQTNCAGGFYYNDELVSDLVIPDGVTTISKNAFWYCTYIKTLVIPSSVTNIEDQAFEYCRQLESLKFMNSDDEDAQLTIGEGAFQYCENLSWIDFGNHVTKIEYHAFSQCGKLTVIDLPSSLTEIGGDIFYNGANLRKVYCRNTTPPACGSLGGNYFSMEILVPYGYEDLYNNTEGWKDFTYNPIVGFDSGEIHKELDLIDGVPYLRTTDKTNCDLTYTRTFNNTNWQPLYIPFSMDYEEWADKAEVAELAGVHMYEDRNTLVEFIRVKEGKLLPNTPYVIRAKETGTITFTGIGKMLYAAPEEGTRYISTSSPRWTYKFIGTYQGVDYQALRSPNRYVMSGGNFKNSTTALNPYRFYVLQEESQNGYWRYTRSGEENVIHIMVDGQLISDEDMQ